MGVEQLSLQPPVPLTSTHPVTDFDCGIDSLNEWLGKRAWKNQAIGVSRTFVVTNDESEKCIWSASRPLGLGARRFGGVAGNPPRGEAGWVGNPTPPRSSRAPVDYGRNN